jgi:predicted nuclease of restriction endonuclease-like (RecB) superfamily
VPDTRHPPLARELAQRILGARGTLGRTADAMLTTLHWELGSVLGAATAGRTEAQRATTLRTLGKRLEARFGAAFGEAALSTMVRFAEVYPQAKGVAALRSRLSFRHFEILLGVPTAEARAHYARLCAAERWSPVMLRRKIANKLFERQAGNRTLRGVIAAPAPSKKGPVATVPLRPADPRVIDLLGLQRAAGEGLGVGFALVERRKRIALEGGARFTGLLFFHRPLRRLVIVEQRFGATAPADAARVVAVLRWLDRHERREGEDSPLALLLGAGPQQELVEMLELGARGVRVAKCLPDLPPRALLRERFRAALLSALRAARARRQPAR